MKKFMLFLSCCLLTCFLVACQRGINSITDFSQFSDMTQGDTESIDVKFDIGGDYYEFIIEDEKEINEVMEIIFSLEFSKGYTEPLSPGDNTRITINQGENCFVMSVRYIVQDDRIYYFGRTLQSKIYDIAEKYGVIG